MQHSNTVILHEYVQISQFHDISWHEERTTPMESEWIWSISLLRTLTPGPLSPGPLSPVRPVRCWSWLPKRRLGGQRRSRACPSRPCRQRGQRDLKMTWQGDCGTNVAQEFTDFSLIWHKHIWHHMTSYNLRTSSDIGDIYMFYIIKFPKKLNLKGSNFAWNHRATRPKGSLQRGRPAGTWISAPENVARHAAPWLGRAPRLISVGKTINYDRNGEIGKSQHSKYMLKSAFDIF